MEVAFAVVNFDVNCEGALAEFNIVFFVILTLTLAGSSICLSADAVLWFVARKTQGEGIAIDTRQGKSQQPQQRVDAVLKFGYILACYGTIALALVSALPGSLAIERTMLVFWLLCIGGLIGEICAASGTAPEAHSGSNEPAVMQREPGSLRLTLLLVLTLNVALAVLGSDANLIGIAPPSTATAEGPQQLDSIVVVAKRTYGPLDRYTASN